uniref:Uncharacterized protein n=1 Tax=Rhizophora mucronata TaxID=61149 RepID=A0A2P2PRW0_RHIMU
MDRFFSPYQLPNHYYEITTREALKHLRFKSKLTQRNFYQIIEERKKFCL